MASAVEQDALTEGEAHRDQLPRKHAVDKIHNNILVGTMKYRLADADASTTFSLDHRI